MPASSARTDRSQRQPDLLLQLRQRAADIAGLPVESLKQALVTEYDAGAAIGWHRDKPMYGEIVALSFLSSCRLRFRRRQADGWERRALDVQPRSAYVLRGAVRPGLGTQHPARRQPALLGDVPDATLIAS